MKKVSMLALAATIAVMFTSCYVSKNYVGPSIDPTTPLVKVQSKTNSFLLWGLVPIGNTDLKAGDYVKGHENYVIEHQQSFVNGVLNVITFGIYSPMTTTYYLPYDGK